MRILVTGGAGFIGSHVAEALLTRGDEVAVLDDFSTGRRQQVPRGAELWEMDLRDDALAGRLRQFAPRAVVHLAAQVSVRNAAERPVVDGDINVMGTLRLLQAAHEAQTEVFVLASTGGAIYGDGVRLPTPENEVTRPMSPYGVSKLCAEHYLDYYGRSSAMRTVALRYANVYGPRQDPHGEAGVVAIFAQRMLRGQEVIINGDGRQTRDYVFVEDVVRANLLALDCAEASGAFNIGTSRATDVNALAESIRKLTKCPSAPRHGPQKAGEQRQSVLDVSRAERVLGFRAQVDLDTGLGRTIEALRESTEGRS